MVWLRVKVKVRINVRVLGSEPLAIVCVTTAKVNN
jgi:hypothetical protein